MKNTDDLIALADLIEALKESETNKQRGTTLLQALTATPRLVRYFSASVTGDLTRLASEFAPDRRTYDALGAVLNGSLLEQTGVSRSLLSKVMARLGKEPVQPKSTALVSVTSDRALLAFSIVHDSTVVLEGFGRNEPQTRSFISHLRKAGLEVCLIGDGHGED